MKITISETQYLNLFESNNEKNLILIHNMWNDGMDIYEISDLIGISEYQVAFYLKDKEIRIDCGFAYQLIQILYQTDLVNKKFTFNNNFNESLEFHYNHFIGSVDFSYENKYYKLDGISTPYWDGNCSTPVDGSYFENKKTGEYIDVYDNSGEYMKNTPFNFKTIQELINFLNNDFPKQIIYPIQNIIKYYEKD
jgi:hypothetical protein